jgi:hypothetical protein
MMISSRKRAGLVGMLAGALLLALMIAHGVERMQ